MQDKYYIYDKTGSIYYRHLNDANNLPILDQSRPHLLLSLPEQFRLGEIVSGDLPPGQMVYTYVINHKMKGKTKQFQTFFCAT